MVSCQSTNGRRIYLRSKQEQIQNDAGKCNGDMERIRDEIAEREVFSSKNCNESFRGFARQKRSWMKKSEIFKRGGKTKQLYVAVQRMLF